jgi:outer membrane protein TolC
MLCLCSVLLGGCAVKTARIADETHKARAEADISKMFVDQETSLGSMSLPMAMARAIRYNMDYRTRMMEEAFSLGQLDVANFDLLPKMTVSAGYTGRNNDAFGFGFGPDGKVTANPAASQERQIVTSKAALSWSVLDFGLSYYRAKQLADQSLVAEERRRKAMQNLVLDVRQAFWRAYAAQQLLPEMGRLLEDLDRNAARAKIILAQKLLSPQQIIAYRRSLLDLQQQLALRAADLAQARLEFAQLINLPPDRAFTLEASPQAAFGAQEFIGKMDVLDQLAIEMRPELREEGYRARISDLEAARNRLAALLPGVSVDYSYNSSSNKYLLNSSWSQVGTDAAINLVKLFSLPAINRSAESQKKLDEARRMAQAAAVLAQIRIAVTRYEVLSKEYEYWQDSVEDDKRYLQTLNSSASVGIETELEIIRAKAKLLGTRISASLAYATLEGAMGRVYNSVGLDVLPKEMSRTDLPGLTEELQSRIKSWEAANFSTRKELPLPPISLAYSDRIEPEGREEIEKSLALVFKNSAITTSPDADLSLIIDVELSPASEGMLRSRISSRLKNKDDKLVLETEQRSTLSDPPSPQQWAAIGEAIGMKVSEQLNAQSRQKMPKALKD